MNTWTIAEEGKGWRVVFNNPQAYSQGKEFFAEDMQGLLTLVKLLCSGYVPRREKQ